MLSIFYMVNKKKQIPLNHLDGVFNCVSQDYVEVFCPDVTKWSIPWVSAECGGVEFQRGV